MLIDKKIPDKVAALDAVYSTLRFATLAALPLEFVETREPLRSIAGLSEAQIGWQRIDRGHRWGDDGINGWFRTVVTIPEEARDQNTFLRIETGAPETLLFVNGQPQGVFDLNHPVRLLALRSQAGAAFDIHLEAYAGHNHPGTQPHAGLGLTNDGAQGVSRLSRQVGRAELVIERADVSAFVFELRTLTQLANALEPASMRRVRICQTLSQVQALVFAKPEEAGEARWRPALAEVRQLMQPLLAARNGPTAPRMGIIGHSHIDTAWLWPIRETWRKCARTFSSVLSLMDQYPEFKFTQSAPYHVEMMRELYPQLFQRICERVKDGRWEINGGMWIEPDCNLPSGESLVRQCLFGQRATREMFGVTTDTLWLPDVFGYSAALPQILRQAGISYFCTTKLGWNDTNQFPFDTFQWQGIDGSLVLSHFNSIHCWPDPKSLIERWQQVQHNDVQDRRLIAFGYGDGGGGPMAEMIEMGRLCADLEGCPKTEYTGISEFMLGCEQSLTDLPTWVGELYLELHRGTLTSIASLKRGNRLCEFALRDAELLATLATLRGNAYPHDALRRAWRKLLLNQFHDILPGSAIAEVNDEARATFEQCEREALAVQTSAARSIGAQSIGAGDRTERTALLVNSLSWARTGELDVSGLPEGSVPEGEGVVAQAFTDVFGRPRMAVTGVELPPMGYRTIDLAPPRPSQRSCFRVEGDVVETPFARVKLGPQGEIASFYDLANRRELVREGHAFNRLLAGEDVPNAWDNWDIDRDQARKLKPCLTFCDREVVSHGPLQLRIRTRYRLGESTTLSQDTVFHSTTPRVDFETLVDWQEKYQLLKASFGIAVQANYARHEMQFGHVMRTTHDNTSWDRAQFDVCAHKWTDISETAFGIAFLNDCKYACSMKNGDYRLTLIKSGRHPDPRGDAGLHRFSYALLPHAGGFSV
ncbi:MAG: alpha-mannosidase, partial [Tepidisphaeraceae bacterium]